MLRWAHMHGCDCDEKTCWRAAGNGHLEVLRWAYEHGPDEFGSECEAGICSRAYLLLLLALALTTLSPNYLDVSSRTPRQPTGGASKRRSM